MIISTFAPIYSVLIPMRVWEAITFHLGICSKVVTKVTLEILFSTASTSVSASVLSVLQPCYYTMNHRQQRASPLRYHLSICLPFPII